MHNKRIGLILKKTGAAIVMAETVIKVLGPRFPTLTMSILLLTGAGGAFAAILKVTPIGDDLGTTLSALGLGIYITT